MLIVARKLKIKFLFETLATPLFEIFGEAVLLSTQISC
jgi:hypothetical protein